MIRIFQKLLRSTDQVWTLKNHSSTGFEDSNPLFQDVNYLPLPEMLDHMNSKNFIRKTCIKN